jgi:hypothetical protein
MPGHVQSVDVRTAAARLTVALGVPLGDAVVRYTTDGSVPSTASRAYRAPFPVWTRRAALRLRAAAFLHGRRGAVTEANIERVSPAELGAHPHASRSWAALVSP